MNYEFGKISLRLLAYTSVLLLSLALPAQAQESSVLSEGSLAISPFLIEANVAPGESYTDSITVFNVTDAPLPIAISVNDFVPSGERGSVRFLEVGQMSHPSFSLASWISITDQPTFTIPPKGETKVAFRVSVPLDAEPGSHYGGLLFSAANSSLDATGTKVIKKVGALILVATGKTNPSGEITHFSSDKQFYTSPDILFQSSFSNTGNVHVAPKGQIAVRNSFGRLVGESHQNKDSQLVLPGQTRGFEGTFNKGWMFGRYTAELTYFYGNPKLEARERVAFWVLPVKPLSMGAGILLLLVLLVRLYNHLVIRRNKR
jgi:hypothetical protein